MAGKDKGGRRKNPSKDVTLSKDDERVLNVVWKSLGKPKEEPKKGLPRK